MIPHFFSIAKKLPRKVVHRLSGTPASRFIRRRGCGTRCAQTVLVFFIFSFALASPIKAGIFPPRYYQPLRVRAITRRGIPDFTSPAGDVSRPHSKIIRCHSEPRPMVECEESPLSIFLAIVAIALSLYRRFFGTLHLRMAIMSSRT